MRKLFLLLVVLVVIGTLSWLGGGGCGGGGGGGGEAPIADAGPRQDVSISTEVTLDGSGSSDPEGRTLTYAWTQSSGATVTLDDATAQQPKFTSLTLPDTYVFSLTVSDGVNTSTPSTVTIRVWQDASNNLANCIFVDGASTVHPADGSMAAPYNNLEDTVNIVSAVGGQQIYVATGTYSNNDITLTVDGVSLYGGYESVNWTRDIATNDTIISVDADTSTVNVEGSVTSATHLDGFSIYGTNATNSNTNAIQFLNNAGITVSQNTIYTGAPSGSNSNTAKAVWCETDSPEVVLSNNTIIVRTVTLTLDNFILVKVASGCNMTITGNTITGATSSLFSAGAVTVIQVRDNSTATISQNTINAGKNTGTTTAVMIEDTATATINRNFIDGGEGSSNDSVGGVGVLCLDTASALIENNIIYAGNGVGDPSGGAFADSIAIGAANTAGTVNVVNNTINLLRTTAPVIATYGVLELGLAEVNVVNNIFVPDSDTAADSQVSIVKSDIALQFNKVYNNDIYGVANGWLYFDGATQYTTIAAMQAALTAAGVANGGNISADPLFQTGSDYLLQSTSPCIDSGCTTAECGVDIPIDDYDGNTRTSPPDIGASQS